jgi:hypothetical protein
MTIRESAISSGVWPQVLAACNPKITVASSGALAQIRGRGAVNPMNLLLKSKRCSPSKLNHLPDLRIRFLVLSVFLFWFAVP